MESENLNTEQSEVQIEIKKESNLNKVTPLSKYLAMALFIITPFIGGWIGYSYAPEKVVEVERVVIMEVEIEKVMAKEIISQDVKTDTNALKYVNKEFGFEMEMSKSWLENMEVEVGDPHQYGRNLFFKLLSATNNKYEVLCFISVSTQEDWVEWNKEEAGKPVKIKSSGNNVFGYGCGHEDEGYVGYEDWTPFSNPEKSSPDGPFSDFQKSIATFNFID